MASTSEEVSRAFDSNEVGHCAWNELSTSDLQSALQFHTQQFGWKLGQTMPMGDMGDYQMFDLGDTPIGGMMKSAAGAPTAWRFYFRVSSLQDAMQRTEQGGGSVIHGPQEVPGDDEIVIATDPQGAVFALVAKLA